MQSEATTVAEYLAELPEDRRRAIKAIRAVIRKNLPKGYQEAMQHGMIGYSVPHSVYPAGYHCDPSQPVPFASLASQKNHIEIYLFCIYTDEGRAERFGKEWLATGKRLDMGKACVRVKKLEDVPLEVVGRAVRVPVEEFIASYEAGVGAARQGASKKKKKKKTAAKKAPRRKAAPNKPAARRAAP